MASFGPTIARFGQQIALDEIHAHGTKRTELFIRLHALGEGCNAALPRESGEATQYSQLVGIPVHVLDQAAIDLYEVRA